MIDLATTTQGARPSPPMALTIKVKSRAVLISRLRAAPALTLIFGRMAKPSISGRSMGTAINNKTQIVGNSFFCNSNFDNGFDHGLLWENGSIVDLNTLIPSGSSLIVVATNDIHDRGEIAGEGLPTGCSDWTACGHAFLLIPCDENHPDVEGCDYSLVEGSATAASSAPATQRPTSIPDNAAFRRQMMRLFGRRWMPWYRGLAASPRD
jgi:probable HAF family extracellular repeat protein